MNLEKRLPTSLGQLVSALHLITQHLSWTCTRQLRGSSRRSSFSSLPQSFAATSGRAPILFSTEEELEALADTLSKL